MRKVNAQIPMSVKKLSNSSISTLGYLIFVEGINGHGRGNYGILSKGKPHTTPRRATYPTR